MNSGLVEHAGKLFWRNVIGLLENVDERLVAKLNPDLIHSVQTIDAFQRDDNNDNDNDDINYNYGI